MASTVYLIPKFGDIEYYVSVVQLLYRNLGGEASFSELGKIFDNSTKSSHFLVKLNAMKAFGFIDSSKDGVKLTDLAERLVAPKTAEELKSARFHALANFPLFANIVDRYKGKGEPELVYVANTLKTEGKVKANVAEDWATVFIKAGRFVGLFTREDSPPENHSNGHDDPPPPPRRSTPGSFLTDSETNERWLVYPVPVESGTARIVVPQKLSRPAWERLKKLLDAIEPEKQEEMNL